MPSFVSSTPTIYYSVRINSVFNSMQFIPRITFVMRDLLLFSQTLMAMKKEKILYQEIFSYINILLQNRKQQNAQHCGDQG